MKPTDLQEYYPRQESDISTSEAFVGGLIIGALLIFATLWLIGVL